MFDMNQLMFGMINARRQRKKLEELGVDIPKNYDLRQALFSSVGGNPQISSILVQNEFSKKIEAISPVAKEQIKKKDTKIQNLVTALNDIYNEAKSGAIDYNAIDTRLDTLENTYPNLSDFRNLITGPKITIS